MKCRILRPSSSLSRAYVIFPSSGSDLDRDLIQYLGSTTIRRENVTADGREADGIVRMLIRDRGYRLIDGGPSVPQHNPDRIQLRGLEQHSERRWGGRLYLNDQQKDAEMLRRHYVRLGLDVPVPQGQEMPERVFWVHEVNHNRVELLEMDSESVQGHLDQHLRHIAQSLEPDAQGRFNWLQVLIQLEAFPAADVKDVFGLFVRSAYRSYAEHRQRTGNLTGPHRPHLMLPQRFTRTVPLHRGDEPPEPQPEPRPRLILPPDRPRKIDLE